MSEISVETVPAGFIPVPTGLGFTDTIQPSYRRIEGDSVSFGLVVQQHHGNLMGICHGGVLMTLADIAAANGVNVARGVLAGSPTINLAVDFISAARIGQWIQADVHLVTVKRRFGFCSGAIVNGQGVVARFNGTFYLPDHKGMVKPGAIGDRTPGFLGE
ncbi:MAG: PaaI family thioesterase [Halioglobus sp.]|nr:PaaI family thioesterase [Halioglobus sp.]MCB1707475.1 PaaI family thioesterase [Halioglobus sp.]MCP5123144.1 PaaI family thioesterase [Pseudomonadales bacterium]MCP5192789.1 PaaI family thioesterase [Pseudomonadales bacterium]